MTFDFNQSASVAMGGEVACTDDMAVPLACRVRRSIRRHDRDDFKWEMNLRLEERRSERARIARDLHDTVFPRLFGATFLLSNAVEQEPPNSPVKPTLSRVLQIIENAVDETRGTLNALRSSLPVAASLEQSLSELGEQINPISNVKFCIFVHGHPRVLQPSIQEQIYLIAQEALVNALRHSHASRIEVQIEYLSRRLRLFIRDNGCGIDPQIFRFGRESHWGLLGMRERAASIGAKLRIWSKPGAGTEVEISVTANDPRVVAG